MSHTYEELALKEGKPYLVRLYFPDGMRHVILKHTLSEAIDIADGVERAELSYVDEIVEGVPMARRLADVMFGEWFLEKGEQEITMAKVKKAVKENGGGEDVADELLGVNKPAKGERKAKKGKMAKGKPGKAKVKKTNGGAGRAPAFTDNQRIHVLVERNVREDSRDGKQFSLIRNKMKVGDWKAACAKVKMKGKRLDENAGGMLSHFVRSGFVKVV